MNIKIPGNVSLFLFAICLSLFSNAENVETVKSTQSAEHVWIDVRSFVEHTIDNIEGDIRIPHDDIVQQVNEAYPNKNTEIHLYCGSGGRAEIAMSALKKSAYTNVSNSGGIDDARKERGLSK